MQKQQEVSSPHVAKKDFGEFLSMRDLQNRGWTPSIVSMGLSAADEYIQNLHFSAARPKLLFSKARAISYENSLHFIEKLADAKKRSAQAKVNFQKQLSDILKISDSLTVVILHVTLPQLEALAIETFGVSASDLLQQKNEVACLAFYAKSHESNLDAFFNHPGIRIARQSFRRRVYLKIMQEYLHLSLAVLEMSKSESGGAAGL